MALHRGILAALVLFGVFSAAGADRGATHQHVSPEQLSQWIGQLGHPSVAKRDAAMAALADVGPAAREALLRAADGPDLEVALRARALLKQMEGLLFTDVSVTLAPSSAHIGWDEPFDLLVTFTNEGAYPAVLPVEDYHHDGDNVPQHVRQIGLMLDVGDYLRVTGPKGQELPLHVNDILDDDDVNITVEARLQNPPTRTLDSGRSYRVRLAEFNRGWARYRMLREGKYTIQFVYQPVWENPKLNAARAGSVASEEVIVEVIKPAPKPLLDADGELRLEIKPSGNELILTATNTWDQPNWINLNMHGGNTAFAEVRWIVRAGAASETVWLDEADKARKFDPKLIQKLEPGESIILERMPLARLSSCKLASSLSADERLTVRARYSNVCRRGWEPIVGAGGPAPKPADLPLRIITGGPSTEELPLQKLPDARLKQ